VTFSSGAALAWAPDETTPELNLTNCVLADITNSPSGPIVLNGGTNGFWKSPVFGYVVTNTFYPFQTAGAGNYYLASGCSFANSGSTNINSDLLANLRQKTTFPPVVLAHTNISNVALAPQVPATPIATPVSATTTIRSILR